jgi:hypothetical protein
MKTWRMAATVWMVAGAACDGAPEKLSVVVFDYASVPTPVLTFADRDAHAAFRAAGVQTDWVVCQVSADTSRNCVLPPPDTYLRVMILPAPAKGASISHNGLAYTHECLPKLAVTVFMGMCMGQAQTSGSVVLLICSKRLAGDGRCAQATVAVGHRCSTPVSTGLADHPRAGRTLGEHL